MGQHFIATATIFVKVQVANFAHLYNVLLDL